MKNVFLKKNKKLLSVFILCWIYSHAISFCFLSRTPFASLQPPLLASEQFVSFQPGSSQCVGVGVGGHTLVNPSMSSVSSLAHPSALFVQQTRSMTRETTSKPLHSTLHSAFLNMYIKNQLELFLGHRPCVPHHPSTVFPGCAYQLLHYTARTAHGAL